MKRWIAAACAVAGMAATPLQAEIVEVATGGFVTRDSATVGADPQAVWLALISPGDWWSDTHSWSGDAQNMTITPQGGGCFCERIPAQEKDGAVGLDGSVQHMVVLQANPRNVLRMRGALGPLQSEPVSGVLTITLKPVAGGTRILWEYVVGGFMRYEPQVIAKAVDGVMSQQLNGLAEKLGRIADPEPAPAAKATPADESGPEAQRPDPPAKPPTKAEKTIGADFLEEVEQEGEQKEDEADER